MTKTRKPAVQKLFCFENGAVRLSLPAALLILLFVDVPSWSASLGVSVVASSVNTSGCVQPTPATTFRTIDAMATVWFTVNDTRVGDHPTVQWFDPNGQLYLTTSFQPGSGGNQCYWGSMNISGSSAAQRLGTWTARASFNGNSLFTLSFKIAASTVRLANQVIARSDPPANCGVPPVAETFSSADSRAYSWMLVNGTNTGDDVRTEWVRPDGSLYTKGQFSPLSFGGSVCLWSDLAISGTSAALLSGNWTVNTFWNGAMLYSSRFALTASRNVPHIDDNGVFDAAGGDPQQPISPGSLVVITGANLAAGTQSAAALPVPANLAGASVTFNGVAAPVAYASPTELEVQVPWIRGDTAKVRVGVDGVWSDPYSVALAPSSPAIFEDQDAGNGQALAFIYRPDGTSKGWMSSTNPASRGDTVVLVATGLGLVEHPPATGTNGDPKAMPKAVDVPAVSIDDIAVPVSYAGMTALDDPSWLGSYQINVQIPAQTRGGAVRFRIITPSSDAEGMLVIDDKAPKPGVLKISSLNANSVAPFGNVTISGSGFDPNAPTVVRFYDSHGFSKSVRPSSVTAGSITMIVPPYFSSPASTYSAGSVSIDVMQTIAGQTVTATAPAPLQVLDLPQLNLPPGQLTATVLRSIQHGAREIQGRLLAQEKSSKGAVNTSQDRATLSRFAQSAADLSRSLQKVASGSTTAVITGSGQKLKLDAQAIHESERLMAAIIAQTATTPAPLASKILMSSRLSLSDNSDDCLLPTVAEIQDKVQGRPPAIPYAQRLNQCKAQWAAENQLQLAADLSDSANRWYLRTKRIFSMSAAAIGLDTIIHQEGFGEAAGFLGLIEAIPIGVQALGQLAATTIAATSGADPEKVAAIMEKTTERQLDVVSDWAGGELLKKGLGLVPVPGGVVPEEAKEIQEVISKFGEGWRETRELVRRRAEQWLEGRIETDSEGHNSLAVDTSSNDLEISGSIPTGSIDTFEVSRAAFEENSDDGGDEATASAESPVYDDGSFLLEGTSHAIGDGIPPSPVLSITGPTGSWTSQMIDLTIGTRDLGLVSSPNGAGSSSGGHSCPAGLGWCPAIGVCVQDPSSPFCQP